MDVLITALARVIVAKPHSADVERLIESYNVVKRDVKYVIRNAEIAPLYSA